MRALRKYVAEESVRFTLWMPGILWNRLVAHHEATRIATDEPLGQLINRWIEAGLDREQPEYHEMNKR